MPAEPAEPLSAEDYKMIALCESAGMTFPFELSRRLLARLKVLEAVADAAAELEADYQFRNAVNPTAVKFCAALRAVGRAGGGGG